MTRYVPSADAGVLGVRRFGYYTAGGSTPPPAFSPLDLSPALWVDPSDASSVTISGSSGAYIGADGLVLPGSGANYALAPYVASYAITGDIDLIAKVAMSDWTPTTTQTVFYRSGGTAGTDAYGLQVSITTGTLRLEWIKSNGYLSAVSTAATGFTDGSSGWVRATLDVDNGAGGYTARFYTSTDGATWAQLGADVVGGAVTSIDAKTSNLSLGGYNTTNNLAGTLQRVIIKNGIGGTTVFDADFDAATPFVSAFTESALGAPIYVVSSTATSSTASYGYVGPLGLTLSGASSQRASTPDSVATSITGDIEIQAKFQVSTWTPTAGQHVVLGKTNAAGSITSYLLRLSSTGHPQILIGNANAANATLSYSATATIPSAGYAAGSPVWVKATLDVDNGATNSAAQFFTSPDGSTWTQLGSTVLGGAGVVAIYDGDGSLTVGRYGDYDGAQWFAGGVIMRAIVKSGIGGTTVYDADFASASDYCTSFTESSSNAATVTITATNTPANAAGACVSQINDKSGNARHLTQGTLANMPKYWNGQNGCNCLVFDGTASSDYLTYDGTTDSVALTSGFTLFAVAADFDSSYGGTENRRLFTARRSATGADDFTTPNFIGANRAATTGYMQCNIAGTAVTGPAAATGSAPFQVTTRTGASGVVRKDGVAGSTVAATYSQSMRYLRLGEACQTTANPPGASGALTAWNGWVGELFLVPSEIADGSLSSPESYNRTKWGTP